MKTIRSGIKSLSFEKLSVSKCDLQRCRTITMSGSKTIEHLGYAFNAEGQLRKLGDDGEITNKPFEFNISNEHNKCQAHYEDLGAAVTEHVYNLLESGEHLQKLPVPKNATLENGTFIFVSKEYDQRDILMVLIHGSGVVRAGQWARSIIINECLDMGTQIPFIKEAVCRGYGVMVLNSNDNHRGSKKIKSSGSAEEHLNYVWKTYIAKTKASSLVIVAHSYGGLLTFMMADQEKGDFMKRVKAVALTDSVHSYAGIKISSFLKSVSRNWIASTSPLDTPESTPDSDVSRVSAGHSKHEMTSYTCMDSVFKFIEDKLKNKD